MIVIKYGGHALPINGEPDTSLALLARKYQDGQKLVLVHGGGPQINAALATRGLVGEMLGGYRKTTPEIFEVVQEVLSGQVLRSIVNQLIGLKVNAVGLSASDGELIRAKQMSVEINGNLVDIGLVGEVVATKPDLLESLLQLGYLPVVSPIGVDESGQGLNLNADLVAGAVGGALKADRVLYMTDVDGIYRSWPDKSSLIDSISAAELEALLPTFTEGMIPKVTSALSALKAGAQAVRIFNGKDLVALERALSDTGGTLVLP